jgi:uncharacterized protein YdhG (YjbR/CyaY superfamily)
VDEYIASFPADVQAVLERVRATVRRDAPDAEEKIGYQMPAYRLHGVLCYFGAFTRHYSLFALREATREAYREQLAPYVQSKGTIQFPFDRPVPVRLITALVKHAAEVNRAEGRAKQAEKPRRRGRRRAAGGGAAGGTEAA